MSLMDVSQKSFAIGEYEKHFNLVQAGIRGLASTWTLAAFAGFSFFLKPEVDKTVQYRLNLTTLDTGTYGALAAVALAGFGGLLVLWILDQLVYHRLLLSSFVVGLCIEAECKDVPPLRWVMAASDKGKAVPDFVRLFYFLPLCAFTVLSGINGVLALNAPNRSDWAYSLFAFTALHLWGLIFMARHGSDARLSTFMSSATTSPVPKKDLPIPVELQQRFPTAPKTLKELLDRYCARLRPTS